MLHIPCIEAPFCTQDELKLAADTVRICHVDRPAYGFTRPFIAPGGVYGECWWSLDAALAVDGLKWLDDSCEQELLYNLIDTQEPDGRVKLYGKDDFSSFPSIKVPIGSLPRFLETCCQAAVRAGDAATMRDALGLIEKNLAWWFANRQDPETRLISAVFEETFVPNLDFPVMEYCPPDTNIQIAAGCLCAAELAGRLGDTQKKTLYVSKHAEILGAVDRYLWDDTRGAYYPYLLSEKSHYSSLLASTFTAIRWGNGSTARRSELLKKLTDPQLFGWGERPITTISKIDPAFCTVSGPYNGNPCWSGSVWTLTNKAAIQALMSAGEAQLAADLALSTVQEFRGSYAEFHHPFTGIGYGVADYAWTAAQFIQIIIEDIFGIRYDGETKRVYVRPNLTHSLKNETMSLEDLRLPNGDTLNVYIKNGTLRCNTAGGTVTCK